MTHNQYLALDGTYTSLAQAMWPLIKATSGQARERLLLLREDVFEVQKQVAREQAFRHEVRKARDVGCDPWPEAVLPEEEEARLEAMCAVFDGREHMVW